jgi:hypothetical protein
MAARSSRTHGDQRAGRAGPAPTARSARSNRSSITASCSHRTTSGHPATIGPLNRPSATCRTVEPDPPSGSIVNTWVPSSPIPGANANSTRRPGSYPVTR